MTRKCTKCLQLLSEEAFNWRKKNVSRASQCKVCTRRAIKHHYQKNTSYYLKKAKTRNILLKEKVIAFLGKYLASHPCVDCGEKDILVLEFDHKSRNDKTNDISSLLKKRLSLDMVKREIAKCEVRCANCHRRKTERETNSWRFKFRTHSSIG